MSEESYTYNGCMGSGCHERCVMRTVVKDGKIVRVERAFKDNPEVGWVQCDGVCQKGVESARWPYMKERLLYPMKRVGERGSNDFERITWDQAMSEIGEKMRAIIDDHGMESLVFTQQWSGYPNTGQALHTKLLVRFLHVTGATGCYMQPVDQGFCYSNIVDFGSMTPGQSDRRLLQKAKYIVLWGNAAIGDTRQAATTRTLLEAQENGAKLVDIGIVFDPCAAKCDQFIPVKTASDAALALSMIKLMFDEGMVEEEYLRTKTVAPFLVREDTGKFLREADLVEGGSPDKYVYWTEVPEFWHAIEKGVYDTGDYVPELFKSVTLNGIKCKTALQMYKEHVAEWTLEKQQEITGVAPEVVRTLVHEMWENREHCTIFTNLGMRYVGSDYTYRAINMLCALMGNLESMDGGGLCSSTIEGQRNVQVNNMGVFFPTDEPKINGPRCNVTTPDFYANMLGEEPKYHALFNLVSNLVHVQPDLGAWEKIYSHLDLVVSYDVRMSDTAKWSDYVLPDTTPFEREELLIPQGSYAILQEPAIPPQGEAKEPAEFWRLLAKEVGVEEYFDKTQSEWNKFRVDTAQDPSLTYAEITYDKLKEEKYLRMYCPADEYFFNPIVEYGYLTETGRMELYSEHLAEAGLAMPVFGLSLVHDPATKQYPLHLFVGRNRFHMQTQFYEFDDIQFLAGDKPWMWLNTKDAEERGIRDGDMVEVFNHKGSCVLEARVGEYAPAGVAHLWLAYPKHTYKKGGPTLMVNMSGRPEDMDLNMTTFNKYVEKKSGWLGDDSTWDAIMAGHLPYTLNTEVVYANGYDTIFDAVCDVRKYEEE